MKANRQTLFFLLVVVLFIVGIAIYQLTFPPLLNGSIIDPPKAIADFTLHSGQRAVSLSDFRGKYVVLYFGYTSCPDVCPLTLANLRNALDKLGDDAANFQVMFVSVDPQRDTPERVAEYASRFRADFVGVSGSPDELDEAAKQFGIFYKLNEPDPNTGFYTVDHTASALVLDRDGNLVMTWAYGTTIDQILSDMRVLAKR